MTNIPLNARLLAKRLLLLIIPYELCRVIFYLYAHLHFPGMTFGHLLHIMFVGLRFDISAIVITNLLYIVLCLIPVGSEESIYRRGVIKSIYLICNSLAIFIQVGDTVFFPYVYKRSTGDIFKFLSLGSDTADIMPSVLKSYWYMLIVWVALIFLTYFLYTLTETKPRSQHTPKYVTKSIISYVVIIGLLFLGYRGGFQREPLSMKDAGDYVPVCDIPLVINSPFSIIKTLDAPQLTEYNFFAPDKLQTIYSPYRKASKDTLRRYNVVTIILESFSKEYIGALNNRHKTCTPFLDSLIGQSLVFDNAFSDGKKSIEGIPAVTASLPSWMDHPFITSDFTGDNFTSLAGLLDNIGYTTAFFHGGKNGTMGFVDFCKKAGFKYYYGKSQYNNEADFDGHWGIWDEPYFQYFAKNLDTLHKPFYAAIFSLSSHHPFGMPDKYKDKFPLQGDEMPILRCVRYSDMALREFFKTASNMKWYDSTLFVFVADHAGPSEDPYYSNRLGMYEIPIIFYMPHSNLKGVSHTVMEQIDILPTILSYIHYPNPYFCFGKNAFDSTANHFAVNYINDVFQVVKPPYCLQMEGSKICALYNFRKDSMLNNNLLDKNPATRDSLSAILEAVMQTYSSDVMHNHLTGTKKGE